jgi:signal transduction histidine kinase/ligand-binding sensor domain-containing protein
MFVALVVIFVLLVETEQTVGAQPHAISFGEAKVDARQMGIKSLARDGDGFLWATTEAGLCRFDGASWDCPIKECRGDLFADAQGSVWGCASNRSIVQAHGTAVLRSINLGVTASLQIVGVVEARIFLAGTEGTFRGHVSGIRNTFDRFSVETANTVVGQGETTWMSSKNGLFRAAGKGALVKVDPRPYKRLAMASDGRIFAAASRGGIDAFGADGQLLPTAFGYRSAQLTSMAVDPKHDRLWISFYGGVATLPFEGGEPIARRDMSNGIPYPIVGVVLPDAEGLWIGTEQGLCRIAIDPGILHIGRPEGMLADSGYSVATGPDGSIWLTQGVGLTRWGKTPTDNHRAQDGLRHVDLRSVAVMNDGAVWTAGANTSLARLDLNTHRFFPVTLANAPDDHRVHMLRNLNGELWMGLSGGGVAKMEQDQWVQIWMPPPHQATTVHDLALDGQDGLWIAMGDGSAAHLLHGSLNRYTLSPLAAKAPVLSVFLDEEGAAWFATEGAGLFRIKNGRVHRISHRDGLWDDRVYSVIEDDSGWLWMSSPRGLSRMERSALDAWFEGTGKAVAAIPYLVEDGLRTNEAARGFSPSVVKDADGRLWFPTVQGAVGIHPGRMKKSSIASEVRITKLQVDGVSIVKEGEYVNRSNGTVVVEALSPQLWSSSRLRYRMRVQADGATESNWKESGNSGRAEFTNVADGPHTISVQAYTLDNPERVRSASWRVVLLPSFYRRAWFRTTVALAIALSVLLGWRARLNRRAELRASLTADRTRIAHDIHDSLEQDLTGMKMHADAAALWMDRDPERARTHLKRVVELVGDGMVDVRNAVWGLRSVAVPGKELVRAIEIRIQRIADAAGIRLRFSASGNAPFVQSLVATQLVYIAREAATNAAKHAQARTLNVELQFVHESAPSVTLLVADDGLGLGNSVVDEARFAGGMGLGGMRQRVELIGGVLRLRSPSSGGTIVEVRAPLQKDEGET